VVNPDGQQGRSGQRRRATAGDVKTLQAKRDIATARIGGRRKSFNEVSRPKSICPNSEGFDENSPQDLDMCDILKFMESQESLGFDICLDSITVTAHGKGFS